MTTPETNAGDQGDQAAGQDRSSLVETIEAPRLKGVSTSDFVQFEEQRKLYERKVQEKSDSTGVSIPLTTIRNSIDEGLLDAFIWSQWAPVSDITEITENHLRDCIKARTTVQPKDYDLALVQKEIKSVRLPEESSSATLETRVMSLCVAYNTKLKECGYKNFIKEQPKLALEHIMNRITHKKLKERMTHSKALNKEVLEKDFGQFVRTLTCEARLLDRVEGNDKTSPTKSANSNGAGPSEDGGSSGKHRRQRGRGNAKSAKNMEGDATQEKGQKRRSDPPDCLLPRCNKKHYIRDCDLATVDEKKNLVAELRQKRRKTDHKSKVNAIQTEPAEHDSMDNSSLFTATYCNGALEFTLMADQGSDVNIISPDLLAKLKEANPSVSVTKLASKREFGNANTNAAALTCGQMVTADVELRVRHGEKLMLRGIKWLVSEQPLAHAYIGRHVLSALGLSNRVLLAAARDRLGGAANVPELLSNAGMTDDACADGATSIGAILQQNAYTQGSTFHSEGGVEEDQLDDAAVYVDLGEDDPAELNKALKKLVSDAVERGLDEVGAARLASLVEKYKSIFRLRLGKSPPADVPPMKVRLEPNSKPIRVKPRRYSPEQRKFLNNYVDALKRMDFAQDMPTAAWQAAPLLVPKKGSKAKFRMAVDLRPVNAATVKESWPMPHIDSELQDFAGSKFFASLDYVSGYWQLPLDPDSYSACGIVTPYGVIASKRVLPGLSNATAHFQSSVEPLFAPLREWLKAWLDDFSLHAKDATTLLDKLEIFFNICQEKNLYLHAGKCRLFDTQLKWCGRIVTGDGYKLDPSRVEGLKTMAVPETADELAQFIYCCRWMSIAIPAFTERIAPLTAVLERAYQRSGRRTTRSIRGMPLSSLSWGTEHTECFEQLQDSLREAVELAHVDPAKQICVFTDASDLYWSGVVTQVDPADLTLPLEEQRHQPLAFLGAAFRGAELGWSTFEKEGFAIFQTFDKVDYLMQTQKSVRVFTDHRNLLFVFAPLALEPALGRHIVSKVQRWALYLSRFSYVIEHVAGPKNVAADMLTRWAKGYRRDRSERPAVCSMTLAEAKQLVPRPDEIQWPQMAAIQASQSASPDRPDCLQYDNAESVWKKGEAMWIPGKDVELQLKILVISHCGLVGHRGAVATASIVAETFWWETMKDDVAQFVKDCLHCITTRTGSVIPRPFGTALHADRPNEVLHMDYLYMGPGFDGKKYILILRDDLSTYVWLWATDACTSEHAADAIANWVGAFGSPKWLVTDQGSHFQNKLINALTEELRIEHHFTTAYCPWANGSVERVCREVLRSCKALLAEWNLGCQDWPAVTECVQSVLDHAPLERLGLRSPNSPGVYRSPLEVFTGHIPVRPLLRALPVHAYKNTASLDELRARQLLNIASMQEAICEMHKEVNGLVSAARKRRVDSHSRKTGVDKTHFVVGDFVLVRTTTKSHHKLQFRWCGPRRISKVNSDWVYEVQNLITNKCETVHARRLCLYRADQDGTEVSPRLLEAADASERRYETAEAIRDIRDGEGGLMLQLEWSGLPDEADRTWEPLHQVHEDLPGLLEDFLLSSGKRALKKRALDYTASKHK